MKPLPDCLTAALQPRPGADRNAVRLVAILALSNLVEDETCPYQRRLRLNEMQAAIQGVRDDLEALAEGVMFAEDGDDEEDDE